jgi:citrate synthase
MPQARAHSDLFLSAGQAARRLGVSLPTLYAYVSRGMVRSEPGSGRERRYPAEDIDRLIRRRDGDSAGAALDWGAPVLESAITAIGPDGPWYRGRSALRLAREASVRDVASLLWQSEAADVFTAENLPALGESWPAAEVAAADLPALERCLALLPHAARSDLRAHDIAPDTVARTGARILRLIAAIVAARAPSGRPIDAVLADAWQAGAQGRQLIRAALILCADHELNVSTFTVRCVASAAASPYLAVLAGLAALRGQRHGGMTERAGAFLAGVLGAPDFAREIQERLQRGEVPPGFGHPLYPEGEPRSRLLLGLLEEAGSAAAAAARPIAAAVSAATGLLPNIDWALGVLGRHLQLAPGAALGLFAVGRTIGWIAHAQEQYASGRLIRPRAQYIGRPHGQDPKSAGVEPLTPA